MNKLLKKAIILILCMTFTSGLMNFANAYTKDYGLEKFLGKNYDGDKLISSYDDIVKVAVEEAKEKVCERLGIPRGVLDETLKDVKFEAESSRKSEYILDRNTIKVGIGFNIVLIDFLPGTTVKGEPPKPYVKEGLQKVVALAFISKYLSYNKLKDDDYKYLLSSAREEALAIEAIVDECVDLCNNKQKAEVNMNQNCWNCWNLKYLAHKLLMDGKFKPIEILDKIKSGESAKNILLKQ